MNALKRVVKLFGIAALLVFMCGCAESDGARRPPAGAAEIPEKEAERMDAVPMKVQVKKDDTVFVFALNDGRAARELYAQLPVTVQVEDFGTNEKIFYPPEALSTEDTPQAEGQEGTLAYYAPWGDVVMFYGHFERNAGLYALGEAVSGMEEIMTLDGAVEISAVG